MSASNRVDLATIHHQLMVEKGVVHPDLLSRYPIYQINGSYYLSFLGKISEGFNRSDLIKRGLKIYSHDPLNRKRIHCRESNRKFGKHQSSFK